MSTSFKQTMKNVVFLWGAISLGIIILVVLYMMTSNIRHYNKQPEKSQETLHEKSFGDIKLNIIAKYGNQEPAVLINMTQNNKKMIENYLLPTHEKGFDYVHFDDSLVIQVEPSKYHIMLFTNGELEDSSSQIWFLSFDGHIKFIRVDDLFDMRRSKSNVNSILGNKHFQLPYISGCDNKPYIVPVEIDAKNVIKITHLLNDRAADLLRDDFEKDIACIHSKLSEFPDQSKTEAARIRAFVPYDQFVKNVSAIQRDLDETLKGSSTSWQ